MGLDSLTFLLLGTCLKPLGLRNVYDEERDKGDSTSWEPSRRRSERLMLVITRDTSHSMSLTSNKDNVVGGRGIDSLSVNDDDSVQLVLNPHMLLRSSFKMYSVCEEGMHFYMGVMNIHRHSVVPRSTYHEDNLFMFWISVSLVGSVPSRKYSIIDVI
ncbi:unnamed protein product [Sphenostylis stenocarpa]|uniref:Uncharacterized protein n=1 Tax=Sphenostylis stenocarpa TaxID=92480 RepID=A0AA87B8L8_9FABA|nr:unnamed protein product [Sphenostylis stenocarpa]